MSKVKKEEVDAMSIFRVTSALSHRNKRDCDVSVWLKANVDMHLIKAKDLKIFKSMLKAKVKQINASHIRCRAMDVSFMNQTLLRESVSFDNGQICAVIETVVDIYNPAKNI
jgi:hypothetical protein